MSTWWEQQQQAQRSNKGVADYSAIKSSQLEGAPPSQVKTLADEAAEQDEIRCGTGPPLPCTKSCLFMWAGFLAVIGGAFAMYELNGF